MPVGKIKIKGAEDYMLAGSRMGVFMVAFSLSANNIGGGCTTGLAQKAFGSWGMSAMWYVLAASIPGLLANGSNAMMAVTQAYAPTLITGIVSAAIISATMSSADSNLLTGKWILSNGKYSLLMGYFDLGI